MADAIILENQVTSSSDEVEERTSGRLKFSGADPDPIQLSDLVALGAAVCLSFLLLYRMSVTFGQVLPAPTSSGH